MKKIVRSLSVAACVARIPLLLAVGLIVQSENPTAAAVNEWTKPTSGSWEEPYWSLGKLPGMDQDTVAFRNPGSKALAISANTAASFPDSLSLNDLSVDAPTNSVNQLLLNWAGLNVPLVVHSNLFIGPNGSLESHYSALRTATANIYSSASFSDYATEDIQDLELWGGTVSLTNGTMTCSNLTFIWGTFIQSGGTHIVQSIYMPETAAYYLQGGALRSQQLQIGNQWGYSPGSRPCVLQTGGVHTNTSISMIRGDGGGSYRLDQGMLVSSSVDITEGNSFVQNGGTSILQELDLTSGSQFALTAGQLVTVNTTISSGYYSGLTETALLQSGGVHTVKGILLLETAWSSIEPAYELTGGSLVAANITILGGILSLSAQGVVSNAGILTLSNYYNDNSIGGITANNASETQYLGQLQISSRGTVDMHASSNQPTCATVLRFSDSHTLSWTGVLQITNWGRISGDHLFIGTNAQGLTSAQLGQVQFMGNGAFYPAKLLSTGELVPISATNEWTKPASGSWEESYWSLGRLPGMDQAFAVFDNPGWKALAIGANTTAKYPDSLSLNYFVVDAPPNSFNQLLLNWAGLGWPLNVHLNLTIGTNGSLISHYSALRAANAYIDGSASFSDYATEDFGQLWLRSGGTVNLTNGTMTCSNLTFYTATFTQSGGTHIAQTINLPVISSDRWPSGIYYLQGGTLKSAQVRMGAGGGYGPEGRGTVWQTGGVHTNVELEVEGWVHYGGSIHLGSYRLDGGLLVSSNVDVYGSFTQGAGTNTVQQLNVGEGGDFWLSGGELMTSNTSVFRDPYVANHGFVQNGGVHTVRGRLFVDGWPYTDYHCPSYEIAGGKLVTAGTIEIYSGALSISSNGVVSNTGILLLSGGDLVGNDAIETQDLGQLQVSGGNLRVHPPNFFSRSTVWRFADSHTLPWTAQLRIYRWGDAAGDHIFFGTNAQGLTKAQLDQVRFVVGYNTTTPAALLSTGELVSVNPPPIVISKSGKSVVLSWPGGYDLVTATNVTGPYLLIPDAASPMTNTFTDPQRYFRLRISSL